MFSDRSIENNKNDNSSQKSYIDVFEHTISNSDNTFAFDLRYSIHLYFIYF